MIRNIGKKFGTKFGTTCSKKTLKRYCTDLWSLLVKIKYDNKCFYCGKTTYLNSHHLISRKWTKTMLNVNCGLCLCSGCHTLKIDSIHISPWIILEKLEKEKPEEYLWYIENRKEVKGGKQNEINYKEEFDRLNNLYKPHADLRIL